MSYTLDYSLALGTTRTGLTLAAQLVNTDGSNSGSEITSGFAEIGGGTYLWHYASFADGFRGGVKFYEDGAAGTILAFAAINPEEVENSDAKTSTRSSHNAADVTGGTTVADAESNIRGADSDTLDTLSDQIDAVKAKTDQIGSASFTYTAPATSQGNFTIWGGNDYAAADSRALNVVITDYSGPDLAGASAVLRLLEIDDYRGDATGAALEVAASIDVNGSTVTLSADLTAAQTSALAPSPPADQRNYVCQFIATTAGGSVVTLATARMTVKKGIEQTA